MKIIKRGFRFAIGKDDISDFLERSENEEGIKRQRHHFTGSELAFKNEEQQNKHDHLPEEIHKGSLDEAERPDALYLSQLQSKNLIGIVVEPSNFLVGQSKALHQFNIPQRFSSGSGKRSCFLYDIFLDHFDLPAQQAG
jgi:hypothetical protein